MDKKPVKLIIDTDCGVDDALALLLAISTKNVEIVAITCCSGNVDIDKVWHNVCRILQHFQRTDIPVYVGCERPLVNPLMTDSDFHGTDGLGNVSLPRDEEVKPRNGHAAIALVDYANKYPHELTLVALGPLTNLVVAQRLNQNFSCNIKNLAFMGGNLNGSGNITTTAEFNMYVDPEAAQVVLTEFTCPILCIPWDPCFSNPINKDIYQKLTSIGTKRSDFMKSITAYNIDWIANINKDMGYFPCDLYAMACILHPELVTSKEKWFAGIELTGLNTRGQMVVDRSRRSNNEPNVEFVIDFDIKKLTEIVFHMLKIE